MKKAPGLLASKLGRDGNPLRRRSDRAEAAVLTGLVAVFVIAGPLLAFAGGHRVYEAGLRQVRMERSWRQVPVTLRAGSGDRTGQGSGYGQVSGPATWTSPAGRPESGVVTISQSALPDHHHPRIWVSAAGRPTAPPISRATVLVNSGAPAVIVVSVLAILLALSGGIVQLVLNRRRLAAWEHGWRAAELRWRSLR